MSHPTQQRGPPYAPRTAGVGGLPTITLDVPISSIFLAIYVAFAIFNQVIFQLNRRRKHKFLIQWVLFGFCMARIMTFVLRIVWATYPTSVNIAIAASIFVNAGILLLYIINLLFALRIFRARQPELGWSRTLHWICKAVYYLITVALCLVISMVVLSVYTLKPHLLQAARDVQLAALTFITFCAAMGPLVLIVTLALPVSKNAQTFGTGEMRHKIIVLAISCVLSLLIAGFRCGTTWETPRPRNDPAWYDSKAAFYCFEFVPEVLTLLLFAVARIHHRFHVPNGSSKRQSFLIDDEEEMRQGSESTAAGSGEELTKEEV
jgi:hypothetical protein